MKNRLHIILPVSYLIICAIAYYAVFTAPRDGLANLPMVFVSLPSIVLERVLTQFAYGSMSDYLWEPLIKAAGLPTGYVLDHLYWFLPLNIFQAYVAYSIGNFIRKKSK